MGWVHALRRTPTRRGWWLAAGAGAAFLTGRLLGIAELYVTGTAIVLVLGAAIALVVLRPPELTAARRLSPGRVHCGEAGRVDLRLENRGRFRSPVVLARDPFDGGRRWARFRVAPIDAGNGATAAYRVPTERRGVFQLGPMHIVRQDPLGLATHSTDVAGTATLIVYPHIDPIRPLPHTRGHDPRGGTRPQPAMGAHGDEFYALRPYVVGDDMRRVHWAASARHEDLLIRQDELPWQGRAAVVLDDRAALTTEDGFEVAVSAAASILAACVGAGAEVRLLSTGGVDSGWGSGVRHLDLLLERLAEIQTTDDARASMTRVMAGLGRSGSDTALAVITTARATSHDLGVTSLARRAHTGTTLVLIEESALMAPPGPAAPPRPVPPVGTIVRVSDTVPFAVAWDRGQHLVRGGTAAQASQ